MTKRYLGLDLSMSSPGFAVIEVEDGVPTLWDARHVKTDEKKTHGHRLGQIHDEMDRVICGGGFTAIIREKGFSAHPRTTQTLFKVVGVCDYVLDQYGYGDPVELAPTTVKKTLTGDGKASKEDVERAVRERLRLPDDYAFGSDDESDACAVVLAYLIREGVIA